MAGHSSKSPSKAHLIHECAGALAYISSLPKEQRFGAGDAARMGTAAHHLLEVTLEKRVHPSEFSERIIVVMLDDDGDAKGCSILKVGAKTPPHGTCWFEVDDAMVEGVGRAYDYVQDRIEALKVGPDSVMLESRTNPVPDRDDTSGTADVTIDAWPTLEVVDYKNGYVLVEHEDNEQLLCYLAGRAHDTGWSHEDYMITVVQPNAFHQEGRVRTFEISRDDLLAFVDRHRAACERADVAESALASVDGSVLASIGDGGSWAEHWLNAGPHCAGSMCDARVGCPAHKRWLQGQTARDFDDDPLEAGPTTIDTLEEAVKVLRWAPFMTAHMKAARAFAENAARANPKAEGLKVVRGMGRRVLRSDIGDPYAIAAKLVKDGIISDNERARLFTEPQMITGPQIEGLVKGKGAKVRKAKLNEDYLVYQEGALKVVLADAPGERVTFNAADDFDDGADYEQ